MQLYTQQPQTPAVSNTRLPWGVWNGKIPPVPTGSRIAPAAPTDSAVPRAPSRPGRGSCTAAAAPQNGGSARQQRKGQPVEPRCSSAAEATACPSHPADLLDSLEQLHAALGAAASLMQEIEWPQQHLPLIMQPSSDVPSQQGAKQQQHPPQQRQQGPVTRGSQQATKKGWQRPVRHSSAEPRTAKGGTPQRLRHQQRRGRRQSREQLQPASKVAQASVPEHQQMEVQQSIHCASDAYRRAASTPAWVRATRLRSSQGPAVAARSEAGAVGRQAATKSGAGAASTGMPPQPLLSGLPLVASPRGADVGLLQTSRHVASPDPEASTHPAPAEETRVQVIATSKERPPHLERIRLCAERLIQQDTWLLVLQQRDWQQQLLQQMQQHLVVLREHQQQQQAILQHHLQQQQLTQQTLMGQQQQQASQHQVVPVGQEQQQPIGAEASCTSATQRPIPHQKEPLMLLHCGATVVTPVVSPASASGRKQPQQGQTNLAGLPRAGTTTEGPPQQQPNGALQHAALRNVELQHMPPTDATNRVYPAPAVAPAAGGPAGCTSHCQYTSRKCAACHPDGNEGRCCCCGTCGRRASSAAAVASRGRQQHQQRVARASPQLQESINSRQQQTPLALPSRLHQQQQREQQQPQHQRQRRKGSQILVLALPADSTREFLLCGSGQEDGNGPLHMSEQQHKRLLELLQGRCTGTGPPGSCRLVEGEPRSARVAGSPRDLQQLQRRGLSVGRPTQKALRSSRLANEIQPQLPEQRPASDSCNCCCCNGCCSCDSAESTCSSESSDSAPGSWWRSRSLLQEQQHGRAHTDTKITAQQQALIDELLQVRLQTAKQDAAQHREHQQQQLLTSPSRGVPVATVAATVPPGAMQSAAAPGATDEKQRSVLTLPPSNSAPASLTAAVDEAALGQTCLPPSLLEGGATWPGTAEHQVALRRALPGGPAANNRSEPVLPSAGPDGRISTSQFTRALGALLRHSTTPATLAVDYAHEGATAARAAAAGCTVNCPPGSRVPVAPGAAGKPPATSLQEQDPPLLQQNQAASAPLPQPEPQDQVQLQETQLLHQPRGQRQPQTLQYQPLKQESETHFLQQQQQPLKHQLSDRWQLRGQLVQQHQVLQSQQQQSESLLSQQMQTASQQQRQVPLQQQEQQALQQQPQQPLQPQPQDQQRERSSYEAGIALTEGEHHVATPTATEPPSSGLVPVDHASSPLVASQQLPTKTAVVPSGIETAARGRQQDEHHPALPPQQQSLLQQPHLGSPGEAAGPLATQSPSEMELWLPLSSGQTPCARPEANSPAPESSPLLLPPTKEQHCLQQATDAQGSPQRQNQKTETPHASQPVPSQEVQSTEESKDYSAPHTGSSNRRSTAEQQRSSFSVAQDATEKLGPTSVSNTPTEAETYQLAAPSERRAKGRAADSGARAAMPAHHGLKTPAMQPREASTGERTVILSRRKQQQCRQQQQNEIQHQQQQQKGIQRQQQLDKPQQQRHLQEQQPQLRLPLSSCRSECSKPKRLPRPVSAPQSLQERTSGAARASAVVGRVREAPMRLPSNEAQCPPHTVRARSRVCPTKATPETATPQMNGDIPPVQPSASGVQHLQQQKRVLEQQQQVLLQQQQVLEQQLLLLQLRNSHAQTPRQQPQQQAEPPIPAGWRQESPAAGWDPQGAAEAESLTSSPSSNWSGSVSSGEVIATPITRRQFVCMQANTLGPLTGPLITPTSSTAPWAFESPRGISAPAPSLVQNSVAEASSRSAGTAGIRLLIPVSKATSLSTRARGPSLHVVPPSL